MEEGAIPQRTVVWAHVGSGRLGLGFCAAIAAEAGHTPVVIVVGEPEVSARTARVEDLLTEHQEFELRIPAIDGTFDRSRVACSVASLDGTDLEPPTHEAGLLVITISIGRDPSPAVAEGLDRIVASFRHVGWDVLLLPCENRLGADYRSWLKTLVAEHDCVVLASVPDRICDDRDVDEVIAGGTSSERVFVSAERPWAWVFTTSDQREYDILRTAFGDLWGDERLKHVPELLPFRRRKEWLVNGSHLVLAMKMVCQKRDDKWLDIAEFMRDADGIEKMLCDIHNAYAEALCHDFPDHMNQRELTIYSAHVRSRLAAHPDTPLRILRRFDEGDAVAWARSYLSRVHVPLKHTSGRELANEIIREFFSYVRRNRQDVDLEVALFDMLAESIETEQTDFH